MESVNEASNDDKKVVKRPYNLVFLLLAILTLIELTLGFWNQGDLKLYINIGLVVVAFTKAYLVAAFFMGIRYQPKSKVIYTIVFGIPLFIAIPVVVIPMLGHLLHATGL
ncbi:MAG: cytochrome C oxidase subunit IV family protein [Candidatus Hodarchaeales archaeon]|jgi:heme/copper-type cytochrome/quinol oxidase subunit 4